MRNEIAWRKHVCGDEEHDEKKIIINLQIIYCGLEFIVHTSFYVGMNRKYSFITHILIYEHVFGERNKRNGTKYGTLENSVQNTKYLYNLRFI